MSVNSTLIGRTASIPLYLCLAAFSPAGSGASVDPSDLPVELKDWTTWVLYQEEEKTCPFTFSQFESHRCAWPTELELSLTGEGGRFSQEWRVYAESWIVLPGDAKHWPQEVTLDGKPAALTLHGDRPALELAAGRYVVSGTFAWSKRPESLAIPKDTGLIQLEVEGKSVAVPDVDDAGNLWLKDRAAAAKPAKAGDRLKLQVFRRVVDEIPLELITRMELEISGAQREELLTGALPDGFIPLRLDSRLPARLEPDGRLRVQVRPGRWTIEFAARHPAETTSLLLKESPEPWPKDEVWVFDARNHLRLVEIEGPAGIDPRQTRLPGNWQELPAYLMRPGVEMKFNVVRRGDPEPEPDNLSLNRNLWLDFEGSGYTIQDQIGGTMTRGWRLEANAPLQLGRVSLDGEPQFITTLTGSEKQGVEVRRGQLALSADSRHEAGIAELPAVGWDQDFQSVGATLHLPPGWDLISASGVDNVPDTWVKRWTLLDIFLVLIAALAVRGLWNWKYGLLALLTLILIWHEPGAPKVVWLNILAAIALLRVLPAGRFHSLVTAYRNLALLALVVISVPFMVAQVRNGLYPQLEALPYPIQPYPVGGVAGPPPAPAARAMIAPEEAPAIAADAMRESREALAMTKTVPQEAFQAAFAKKAGKAALDEIDPDALVQTGPGLPDWQWKRIALNWNGPVQKDQHVSLLLMSPGMNLLCNLVRVLLVAALAVLVFGFMYTRGRGLHRPVATLMATALILPALLFAPPEVRADIPNQIMLDELKTRLLAPPECLPQCAQSPRLRFDLMPDSLTVRIEIHALEDVAAPLPARNGMWLPGEVLVDGAAATALMRDDDGTLWVSLEPGPHQIVLRGAASAGNSFQLPLPLAPRFIEYSADGWSVEGVADNFPVGGQLQFTRLGQGAADESIEAMQPQELPPFMRVERTLRFGLDWSVETRVLRASPRGAAVVIAVPLIPGESVTTDGVKIEDGKVQVNLSGAENLFAWESSLEKSGSLSFTADETTAWTEVWRADVSPVWHVATSGIAVVHHQDPEGRWLPEWHPWPGEGVKLAITRPEGVAGQTLTIDQTEIRTTPGKRATDATLNIVLRSSQGGQHTLTLPEDAQLQSVLIDDVAQPIRQEGRSVTLPVAPRAQNVLLSLRSPSGMNILFRTPEIGLGAPSVNTRINVTLGNDRWVLILGGPRLGPAVLFWGVLLVVVLIAVGLGRVDLTPLRTWHWILLGIGLTQTSIGEAVVIVGWLLALGARARLKPEMGRIRFNFIQAGLGILTLAALVMLFNAIKQGLLGLPEMQITGNNSSTYNLNWYQDRSAAALPQAWIFSVPLWFYRGLMLAWALWLAFALLRWLKWAWTCYTKDGYWKSKPRIEKPAQA